MQPMVSSGSSVKLWIFYTDTILEKMIDDIFVVSAFFSI